MTLSVGAHVLYVDWSGHPAPLSECYHATGSRRLSSSVVRHPRPTSEAVDNAYCPNCLAPQDKAALSRSPFCPKATCQRCPLCNGPAQVTAVPSSRKAMGECDGLCVYQCGQCGWTSVDCHLQRHVQIEEAGDDGMLTIDRLELARAAEDLLLDVKTQRANGRKSLEDYFGRLKMSYNNPSAPQQSIQPTQIEPWTLDTLATRLCASNDSLHSSLSGIGLQRLCDKAKPQADFDLFKSIPDLCFQMHTLNSCQSPLTKADLLPLYTPLRTRLSRRCRAELAEGRPGIIIKPKLDPLDGDSSQRIGLGQWSKKVYASA